MPTHAPTPPSTASFSFVSYPPAEYIYPHNYGAPPQSVHPMPGMSMPQMELPGVVTSGPPSYPSPYATNMAYAHLGPMGNPTPPNVSPMLAHSHLPPSPVMHNPHSLPQTPPTSPDRCNADSKVMRHILTAMTKMQSTMKDLAERQEQILDRMSLLEQRGKFYTRLVCGMWC